MGREIPSENRTVKNDLQHAARAQGGRTAHRCPRVPRNVLIAGGRTKDGPDLRDSDLNNLYARSGRFSQMFWVDLDEISACVSTLHSGIFAGLSVTPANSVMIFFPSQRDISASFQNYFESLCASSRCRRRRYSREGDPTSLLYDASSRALIWDRFFPCSSSLC